MLLPPVCVTCLVPMRRQVPVIQKTSHLLCWETKSIWKAVLSRRSAPWAGARQRTASRTLFCMVWWKALYVSYQCGHPPYSLHPSYVHHTHAHTTRTHTPPPPHTRVGVNCGSPFGCHRYFETSAKDSTNVEQAFQTIAKNALQQVRACVLRCACVRERGREAYHLVCISTHVCGTCCRVHTVGGCDLS